MYFALAFSLFSVLAFVAFLCWLVHSIAPALFALVIVFVWAGV